MKFVGISQDKFLAIVKSIDPHLKWTVQGTAVDPNAANHQPNTQEGYLSYSASTLTPWKCFKDGAVYHKPCAHMTYKVVRECLVHGATKVWAFHVPVMPWSGMNSTKAKLEGKLQSQGLTCNCPEVQEKKKQAAATYLSGLKPLVMAKPTPSPAPVKKVIPPKPPTIEVDLTPIKGPALTDGDATKVPSGIRNAMATITGLYVLVELDRVVEGWRRVYYQRAPDGSSCTHRKDTWCEDPSCESSYDPLGGLRTRIIKHRHPGRPCAECQVKDDETRAKARAEVSPSSQERILVEGGLASYREEWVGEDSENINIGRRILFSEFTQFSAAYKAKLARNLFDYCALASVEEAKYNHGGKNVPSKGTACNLDPRTFLPAVEWIFRNVKFDGGYGGQKWGDIAKGAAYFYQFQTMPVVFADHVVDLTHNGGVLFNKGYIFDMQGYSQEQYMAMLDYKKHGSLLDGKWALTLTSEVYLMASRVLSQSGETGKTLRKLKQVVADVPVKTIKWGEGTFTLEGGTKLSESAQVNPDDDDSSPDLELGTNSRFALVESTRIQKAS